MLGELVRLWRTRSWLKSGGIDKLDWMKLKSRKLWMTIIGSVVLTVLTAVGAPENIVDTLKWVLITYLGVQGAVDFSAARNGHK